MDANSSITMVRNSWLNVQQDQRETKNVGHCTWVIPVSSVQNSLSLACSLGCTNMWNSDSISPVKVFRSTAGNSTAQNKNKIDDKNNKENNKVHVLGKRS